MVNYYRKIAEEITRTITSLEWDIEFQENWMKRANRRRLKEQTFNPSIF